MTKPKQIQIPEELFFAIVKYHLLGLQENETTIKKGLEEKMDSIVKRQLYTEYKNAPTPMERERARQKYLDKVGMLPDFRW